MKRHGNVNTTYAIITTFIRYEHTRRKHVLLGVGCNELRLRNESKVYQYGGNWFAAVSCVCIRDRLRIVGHLQQRMKMENRRRVSVMELVDEMFWSELMNNSDVVQVQRQMINSVQRWILYCCMNIFVKTVLLFAEQDVNVSTSTNATFWSSVYFDDLHLSSSSSIGSTKTRPSSLQPDQRFNLIKADSSSLQPDQRRFIVSSFVLLKSSTSELQLKLCILCRDWQHLCINCDILYNIVNCAFTVLLYCYCNAIVTSVCPSISKTHYQILSNCRELEIFLITKIPTPWVYSTSPLFY